MIEPGVYRITKRDTNEVMQVVVASENPGTSGLAAYRAVWIGLLGHRLKRVGSIARMETGDDYMFPADDYRTVWSNHGRTHTPEGCVLQCFGRLLEDPNCWYARNGYGLERVGAVWEGQL